MTSPYETSFSKKAHEMQMRQIDRYLQQKRSAEEFLSTPEEAAITATMLQLMGCHETVINWERQFGIRDI